MEYDKSYLKKVFDENSVALSDIQAEKLCAYFELLSEWNKIHNLTSVIDWESVCVVHFLDSVIPADMLSGSVLDVGAGAGFPSIPLAIMTDCNLVALDSVGKKVDFMNLVKQKLKLDNFIAVHARAEDYVKMRNDFDFVLSRGVAAMNVLSEYCLPFLRIGGHFLAYKSRAVDDELKVAARAISLLGGGQPRLRSFDFCSLSRTIVDIEKVSATPSGYPRGGNKPRTKPIV